MTEQGVFFKLGTNEGTGGHSRRIPGMLLYMIDATRCLVDPFNMGIFIIKFLWLLTLLGNTCAQK